MIIVVLIVLGLVFGSFVNALVWRLHEQETRDKKANQTSSEAYSILRGRSMCPCCHHTLAAKDLVPVLSWLGLHGRCRYCHKPISSQYPAVELLTGFLFVLSYVVWPYGLDTLGVLLFVLHSVAVVLFMALAVYDLHWFLLPNKLVYPLIAVAVLQVGLLAIWRHDWNLVWAPVLAVAVIFGLFWGLFQASRGEWIGGGDVKLALALGLLAGSALRAVLVIFFASLIGTAVGLPDLMSKKGNKKRHRVPFGPPLLLAAYIVILFGSQMVTWYEGIIY